MIDVRHEQAAAMMANAYARLTGRAGVCSTASGPAATNLPRVWRMRSRTRRPRISIYAPENRLNSSPFDTMGVGVPFGVGAKAARPDKPGLILHGDGSFGLNTMEMDTAVRHNLPIVTVISLNGSWTTDHEGGKIGRGPQPCASALT
jgi:thiamine pyrophosphate-dependent acetolactate synthase large subunit-like protein